MTSRRKVLAAGALVGLAMFVFVLVWFEPHKLFIDDVVDEAAPTVPTTGRAELPVAELEGPPPGEAVATSEPERVAEGPFRSRSHGTSGQAVVLGLPDGSRVLRLEELATDNGPDLFVYLSTAAPDAPEDAFDDDFIDLGALKGNVGSQNYDVPAGADLARYRTVVIWCRRFTVAFGTAPLA